MAGPSNGFPSHSIRALDTEPGALKSRYRRQRRYGDFGKRCFCILVSGTWLVRIEAGLLLAYAKGTGPGAPPVLVV